jgi:hypothetical protein
VEVVNKRRRSQPSSFTRAGRDGGLAPFRAHQISAAPPAPPPPPDAP